MEDINKAIQNYVEKINCFVACLKCEIWVLNADETSIDTIFNSAIDIERTISNDKVRKLRDSLKVLYPEHDFCRCGDLVLETLLLHGGTNESILFYALRKYIDIYSKNKLCTLLFNLLRMKKLKEETLCLISKMKTDDIINMLEVKTFVFLWEQMVADNDEKLENCLLNMFQNKTSLFLDCLKVSSKSTGQLILTIILKYLNSQPDLKMWFMLLNHKNIKMTSSMCLQYPELLAGLLEFFSKYAAQAKYQEGESFSWSHSVYPLNEFIDIVNYLLINDGLVGITVNDFITKELRSFDENFSFWLDVKALL